MNRIYESIIEHARKKKDKERLALAHKVWDPTPYVIDVYIGKSNDYGDGEDESNIRTYCKQHFGMQSWPIHNKPANWYRGGATVDGWTWYGFKTEEMMDKFSSDWPGNTKKDEINGTN